MSDHELARALLGVIVLVYMAAWVALVVVATNHYGGEAPVLLTAGVIAGILASVISRTSRRLKGGGA